MPYIFNPQCPRHWDRHYTRIRSRSFNAPRLEVLKTLLHRQGEKEVIGVGIYLRESADTGCIRLMNGEALDRGKVLVMDVSLPCELEQTHSVQFTL